MAKPFAERIAQSVDHPIEGACACRPRWTTRISALCAGLGAGIGSVVGGTPLWAGIGGGGGALIGYLIVWLRMLGSDLTIGMALALATDRLELYRLSAFGGRARGLIRAIPYVDVTGIETNERILEIGVDIETTGDTVKLDTSKRGIGAGAPFVADLRRRIAA